MARPSKRERTLGLSDRLRKLVEDTTDSKETQNRRGVDRVGTFIFAKINVDADIEVDCVIRDMSDGGARIRLEEARPLPATMRLTLTDTAQTRLCRLAWQQARNAGLEFWDAKRTSYNSATTDELEDEEAL
ncbi:MAG: PilZ domain-containing protein [Pseudomonadota bacterium]